MSFLKRLIIVCASLCVVLLITAMTFVFNGSIRTYTIEKSLNYVLAPNELEVELFKVDIDYYPFQANIQNVLIQDYSGDTLIFTENLELGFKTSDYKSVFVFSYLNLTSSEVYLDRLIRHFSENNNQNSSDSLKKYDDKKDRDAQKFSVVSEALNITDLIVKCTPPLFIEDSLFYSYCNKSLSLNLNNAGWINESYTAQIDRLVITSGGNMQLGILKTGFRLNDQLISLRNLDLSFGTSYVKTVHLFLKYDSWDSFNDFSNEVLIYGKFQPSILYAEQIRYFIPQDSSIKDLVLFSGTAYGTLNKMFLENVNMSPGSGKIKDFEYRIGNIKAN